MDAFAASVAAILIWVARDGGLVVVRQTSVTRNVFTVLMPLVWVLVVALHRGYDRSWFDEVARTRGRIVQAALTLTAAVASACLALQYTNLMDLILFGIPLTALLTVLMRLAAARWLRTRGLDGHGRRALIVGHATPIAGLLAAIGRDRTPDVKVVAACLVEEATEDQLATLRVPVYGDLSNVPQTARAAGCDTVIVSPSAQLDTIRLRQLGWDLNDAGIEMLVAPSLGEVAQERIVVRPAGSVTLLHVRAPMLTGPQRVLKGLLDRIAAASLLVLLSPAMVVISLLVRTTSHGPAFFRQRRVGRAGVEFTCLKFRTMVADAEARKVDLAHLNERHDGLLFKIRADPRITRVGTILRRYSLDELPQLINVLKGDMSLVGPRPPLPQEVAAYDNALRRRLLVKPGMTGLWQVSGRSELSWAESVRLDLNYVDNWSPALDARILLRTVSAVVTGTGAY